jgi:hypothetical protein
MFDRFAAAVVVASCAVAFAALILQFIPVPSGFEGRALLATVWCLVPPLWGVWAMLTPRAWMPRRLPLWGAILGLMAGTLAAFVLDFPARVAAVNLTVLQRSLVLPAAAGLYYLLWIVVRRVCEALRRGKTVA